MKKKKIKGENLHFSYLFFILHLFVFYVFVGQIKLTPGCATCNSSTTEEDFAIEVYLKFKRKRKEKAKARSSL